MTSTNAKNHELPGTTHITQIIDALCAKLASYHLEFRGYTSLSVSKYDQLPGPVRQQIAEGLGFALQLVNSAPEGMTYDSLDQFLLSKASQALGLFVPESFLKKVRSGDIVEIYDITSQTQLYRNFEFLRNSSYDLLTVCVTPYPQLFAREDGFEEKIMARIKEITQAGRSAEPWNVANHYLVEKLESHHRKFFLNLGSIAPVCNSITGEQVAWASTIRVVCLGSSYQRAPNVFPL